MSDRNISKLDLIETIQKIHANLVELIAIFTNSEKIKPVFDNGWSIKDMMAHIASCERVGFDIVQPARDSEPLKLYISKVFENVDKFNAETYQKNMDIPLSQIEIDFQIFHKDFVALIETLSDEFIK
ncbi:ClbS/DfsB family four-helix bundle protein, partial [Chloroflexota bacterium]